MNNNTEMTLEFYFISSPKSGSFIVNWAIIFFYIKHPKEQIKYGF